MSFRGFFRMGHGGYRRTRHECEGDSGVIIDCPVCGPRHLAEFSYGGEASCAPVAIDSTDRQAWETRVFARQNPRGPHEEHWQHAAGCRSWLQVRRDVTSHRIEAVRLIGPFADRAGS